MENKFSIKDDYIELYNSLPILNESIKTYEYLRKSRIFCILLMIVIFYNDDRGISVTVIFKMLKNKKNNKRKSSKSRNKRIITIYSSQNSILESVGKGTSLPLKKANKSSVTNLNVRTK